MKQLIENVNEQPSISNKFKRLDDMLIDKNKGLNKLLSVTDNLYMDWKCGEITKAELIDNIYVDKNKAITVKFNFEDQHKRILKFISDNTINIQAV